MSLRKPTTFTILVAAALATGGATECGQILDDAGFDLWCDGDRLCVWVVEKGEVRRAPTWHSEDAGVELVGDDTAIYQTAQVNSNDGRCVRFELVADIDETAEVMLQLDVFGDGTIEHEERIPTSDWRRLSFLIRMPDFYQGVRFRLHKRGGGHAVVANIGAEIATLAECPGAPIAAGSRPDGVACTESDQCTGGLCAPNWVGEVCSACDSDTDCAGGGLCTYLTPLPGHLYPYRLCVPPASVALGGPCGRDDECASGACEAGYCSACAGGGACPDGSACLASPITLDGGATWLPGPHVCGGDGTGAAGAACVTDAHCASGTCVGTPLRYCLGFPARACDTDIDCPLDGDGVENCVTVGSRGGSCQ